MNGYENTHDIIDPNRPPYNTNLAEYGSGYLAAIHTELKSPRSLAEQYSQPMPPLHAIDWRVKINKEELRRKEICRFLIEHTPEATYESCEDPAAYIAVARDVNVKEEVGDAEYWKSPKERERAVVIVDNHLHSHEDRVQYLAEIFPYNTLRTSLHQNLLRIILAGHTLALRDYVMARNGIVRRWLPDATMTGSYSLYTTAKENNVNRNVLEAAKAEVSVLEWSKQRLPNFAYLQDDTQQQIVDTFTEEWWQFCDLAATHDPLLITQASSAYSKMPFTKLSLATLTQAITQYPDLLPKTICSLYRLKPTTFHQALEESLSHTRRKQYLQRKPAPDLSSSAKSAESDTRISTKNREAILRLQADPAANHAILNLENEQILALTPEGDPLTRDTFENTINVNTELFARTLYEVAAPFNPRGARLGKRGGNIATELCGETKKNKFHGPRKNITITRMPATAKDLQECYKEFYNQERMKPELAAILMYTAEIQSTGRKPAIAAVQVLIAVETGETYDSIHQRIMKEGNTGRAIVESYHQESSATATVLGTGLISRGVEDLKGRDRKDSTPTRINLNRRPLT